MYVIFLVLTPCARAIARRWGWDPVVYASFAVWAAAQFGLRAWFYRHINLFGLGVPENSTGAFDMYAWQLLWMVGLALGSVYADQISGVETAERKAGIPRWLTRLSICIALVFLVLRYVPADRWMNPDLRLAHRQVAPRSGSRDQLRGAHDFPDALRSAHCRAADFSAAGLTWPGFNRGVFGTCALLPGGRRAKYSGGPNSALVAAGSVARSYYGSAFLDGILEAKAAGIGKAIVPRVDFSRGIRSCSRATGQQHSSGRFRRGPSSSGEGRSVVAETDFRKVLQAILTPCRLEQTWALCLCAVRTGRRRWKSFGKPSASHPD